MNLGEQLLAALSLYGLPILGSVLFVGCLGLPLPNALLLIASGSFTASGQMDLWTVLVVGSVAAIAGDLTGFAVGRWAGKAALRRLGAKSRERLDRAEESVRRWGGWGIFLTRWLITPVGPWVNLLSGASEYPWYWFVMWDVLGEILWVTLYVLLGRMIAGEVQAVSSLAGDISWILLALAVAGLIVWRMMKGRHRENPMVERSRQAS